MGKMKMQERMKIKQENYENMKEKKKKGGNRKRRRRKRKKLPRNEKRY